MADKAAKNKLKQELREAKNLAAETLTSSLRLRETAENPLLKAFKKFTTKADPPAEFSIQYLAPDEIPAQLKDDMFALLKGNMEEMYKAVSWGWDDAKKREELFQRDARYFIASDAQGGLAGYTELVYELDDKRKDIPIAYLFEMQVMSELLARQLHLQLLRLTVFTANTRAIHFYVDKMKYSKEISTDEYTICAKIFPKIVKN